MKTEPNNKSTKKNPVGRFMVAAGAVFEYQSTRKILVVHRNKNLDWHPGEWEIGYGRLDQFEDIEKGLRRETKEELGLKDIKIIRVLRIWHMYRGSKKVENELLGVTFHCRTNTQKIRLSEEHTQYKWLSPQKALKLVTNEEIKEDVRRFIKLYNHSL